MLTCNSHPSSSFLFPQKPETGPGITHPCQETYQLLCHDVVVTEGLEQGHEANLTASWGRRQKARYYLGFCKLPLSRHTNHSSTGCRSVCQSLEVRQVEAAPPLARGRAPNFHLCGFPRFRENFSQVKKKWKEQERKEKNKKYRSFFSVSCHFALGSPCTVCWSCSKEANGRP